MSERAEAQLRVIKAVTKALGAAGIPSWLFGAQPPAEACEFTWDGVDFSTAYFDRQPDGAFSQVRGRWSDWLFPPGSFGGQPGTLMASRSWS